MVSRPRPPISGRTETTFWKVVSIACGILFVVLAVMAVIPDAEPAELDPCAKVVKVPFRGPEAREATCFDVAAVR